MHLLSFNYIIMSPELEAFGGYPEHAGEESVLREQVGKDQILGKLRELYTDVSDVPPHIITQGPQVVLLCLNKIPVSLAFIFVHLKNVHQKVVH